MDIRLNSIKVKTERQYTTFKTIPGTPKTRRDNRSCPNRSAEAHINLLAVPFLSRAMYNPITVTV